VLEVAKRAGFTLDEARLLLQRTDAGTPAFESLRELAARKLPEFDALIGRAREMRAWLLTATDCSCTTLDVCAVFASTAASLPSRPTPGCCRSPASAPRVRRASCAHPAAAGATACDRRGRRTCRCGPR
jgi:hypothetical protein